MRKLKQYRVSIGVRDSLSRKMTKLIVNQEAINANHAAEKAIKFAHFQNAEVFECEERA